MSPTRLRRATAADFRAWATRDPDPEWTEEWFGYVVERDGAVIAIGVVSLDRYGRFWAWTDMREPVAAVTAHRGARMVLRALRQAGAGTIHCFRDGRLPTSERWLLRLGFRPAPEIETPRDKPVWICDLTK